MRTGAIYKLSNSKNNGKVFNLRFTIGITTQVLIQIIFNVSFFILLRDFMKVCYKDEKFIENLKEQSKNNELNRKYILITNSVK
jgi:hypothetical protein